MAFSPNGWGFFCPNFTYLLHVPIYARLQIFIPLSANLIKLRYRPIKRDHRVYIICAKCPPLAETTLAFSDIFLKQLGILSPHFTCLLHVAIYVRLQIFTKLPPAVTKLYIFSAATQRAFWPIVDILSIMVPRLIWHNFVKVADN